MKKSGKKNVKNSANLFPGNPYELLGQVDERTNRVDESVEENPTILTSSRGRTLKRTTPFEPAEKSPPHKRPASTANSVTSVNKGKGKAKASSSALPPPPAPPPSSTFEFSYPTARINGEPLPPLTVDDARYYLLADIIKKQNHRIESLENLIRDELLPRISSLSTTSSIPTEASSATSSATTPLSPPSSPGPKSVQIPGLGLDVSHCSETVREFNAGTIRARVNYALKTSGRDIECIGINDKGNGRYRLLFKHAGLVNLVRRDESWLEDQFPGARLYGEQWYPLRLDRVSKKVIPDETGCRVFGKMNGVKVHKMRFLGKATVDLDSPNEDPGYRSMVVYLDTLAEAEKLLQRGIAICSNGETAFTKAWEVGRQPARCYRCHQYGHLHYRCRAITSICGQCSLPGHSAADCTSTDFKCAACKGPHKASDSGCPVYRRELQKVRPSRLI